ncbi:MAG: MaoC/PaaZ C-terminal domain-containing protein [Rhodospirillales bacterium]|nr:MaoC/PaaZ C-terminal domain-containing protein [Rhodospirillales bacterium]
MSPAIQSASWKDIEEGAEVCLPFTVSDEDMNAFARLSGDESALHTEPDFARRKGFESRVVYGGLIVAHISRLLGMHLPGRDGVWNGLKIDFRRPLYPNQPACVIGRVSHRSEATLSLSIKLRVESGDRLIATGSADVSVLLDE